VRETVDEKPRAFTSGLKVRMDAVGERCRGKEGGKVTAFVEGANVRLAPGAA